MGNDFSKPLLVSIIGPTAVGKTTLAIKIAEHYQTEIVSVDSRQFYKELNIGTAKPNSMELSKIQHHFIDSLSIHEPYSAGQYGREAIALIKKLNTINKVVVLIGGSSLYLKAIWEGFDKIPEVDPDIRKSLNEEFKQKGIDPLLHELEDKDPDYYYEVDRKNGQRIIRALEVIRSTHKPFSTYRKSSIGIRPYRDLKIGLLMERKELFDRINLRIDMMIDKGLFQEAGSLVQYKEYNALQTVGYKEIFGYLEGKYDKAEAIRLIKRNSRRYAKRQMTWLRRYDDIHWFAPGRESEIIDLIELQLS